MLLLHSEILTEAISTVRVPNYDHKFHAPTATEHKYDKTRIENWPYTGIELGSSDWLPMITTTILSSSATEKTHNILRLIHKVLEQP